MNRLFENIQPAIKQETKKVAISTAIGVTGMLIVFLILHMMMPQKIPFDYTVVLGGICGGMVAVLNFFLMGLTVQKVTEETSEERARTIMKSSYSKRMLMQMVWGIVAITAPCFQFVAGLIPLLFPSIGIKIMGIMKL